MLNLKDILKGKVLILCLGNLDRGDDGVGIRLSAAIKGKVKYEVIDAGVTPEDHIGVINRLDPDNIIIVDAIHFEGNVGDMRIFRGEDLRSGQISTHNVSPKLLIEYLASSTKAEIYILGIKPKSNKFGEALSEEVEKTVKELEDLFLHAS